MPFLLTIIRSCIRSSVRPRTLAKLFIAAGLGMVFVSLLSIGPTVRAESMPSYLGNSLQQDATDGKAVFDQKCAGCHTIGGGNLVGPDLENVTKVRDLQWIKDFILDPDAMIASDADAQQLYKEYNNLPMPNLGLTTEQVDNIVEYLDTHGEVTPVPEAPVSTSGGDPTAGDSTTSDSTTGDSAVGKLLFTGELALENGGPACLSCHSVSGIGALGGGGLGPDLTQVIQRFGEPGLAAAMKTLPFPTMLGPFQNRLLTPAEQADLVMLFKDSNQLQDPVPVVTPGTLTTHVKLFFGIALVIAGLLFGMLWILWIPLKKRYQTHLPVRKV